VTALRLDLDLSVAAALSKPSQWSTCFHSQHVQLVNATALTRLAVATLLTVRR
jgi:hypothetical protein